MKSTNEINAQFRLKHLKSKNKSELFDILMSDYKVYSKDDSMPKSWIIYDIIREEYGRTIADKLC